MIGEEGKLHAETQSMTCSKEKDEKPSIIPHSSFIRQFILQSQQPPCICQFVFPFWSVLEEKEYCTRAGSTCVSHPVRSTVFFHPATASIIIPY